MQIKTVTFENNRGERLAARLDLPVDTQPVAYALFAHCFTCSKNLKAVTTISRALTTQGYAVLRFDFTGLGESEGDFSETTFATNLEDLRAACRFLSAQYEPPALLIGHSLGGAAVLAVAGEFPEVKAVATIGAPCDPAHVRHLLRPALDTIETVGEAVVDLGGRPFRIKKQFLEELERVNLEEQVSTMRRPLLLFHSPTDQIVGIENAACLFQAARHPKSFVSLDQADHLLSNSDDAAFVGEVLGIWARRYVGRRPVPDTHRLDPGKARAVVRTGRAHYRTDIVADGHALVADEPAPLGGTDAGPSPYGYLAAALGSCTTITLRLYADRKGWPLEAATAYIYHEKVHLNDCAECVEQGIEQTSGGKIDRFTVELTLEGALDAAQQQRLLEIAGRCPVHRTLKGPVVTRTRLRD